MGSTERIKQFIDYKGISKYKFCKDLGFSNKFLDNSSNMGTDKASKILHYFPELSPEWLLTGKGKMLINNAYNFNATGPTVKESDSEYGSISFPEIPLIPTSAFAGFGGGSVSINENDIQERYVVPDFTNVDFMIRVTGSSMYPKYNSGDVVACRLITNSNYVQWNKVHVIATRDQGVLIKRLKKGTNSNLIAVSDNKDYDPFEIPKDDILNLALVIGVIRLE